jgi:hypothetical protein
VYAAILPDQGPIFPSPLLPQQPGLGFVGNGWLMPQQPLDQVGTTMPALVKYRL